MMRRMAPVFNRDESRILTWSRDKTARLWDASSGQTLLTLTHQNAVDGAVFNRDGSRILTWSRDKTARLWDASSGQTLLTLTHQDSVDGAVFNRDGSRNSDLVSG